jgi:hypothetical protein
MTDKPIAAFEIPLLPVSQSLQIPLSGFLYQFVVYWCWPSQCWMLDIYNTAGDQVKLGTPLVTGADLLAQFRHLGIAGQLVVQTDHQTMGSPTFNNLGQNAHLYYVPFDQGT